MKCPKCGYEDLIFELPANVRCPECSFKYEYKKTNKIMSQISTHSNESGRENWSDADFDSLKEAEDYVSGWIMYSEDNTWRYYQQEDLISNHGISTWIRIRKIKVNYGAYD